MKTVLAAVFLSIGLVFAHEGHHAESMKATSPHTGGSIWQLDSEWKDQNGSSIKLSSLVGKPALVVMLYTKCKTACPVLTDDLKEMYSSLKTGGHEVEVAVFSFDSKSETPTSLKEFKRKRSLPENWQLLTSTESSVAELAGALGVRYKRLKDGEYIHSNVIFLLDKNGDIAAQKEGLNTDSKDFLEKVRSKTGPGQKPTGP